MPANDILFDGVDSLSLSTSVLSFQFGLHGAYRIGAASVIHVCIKSLETKRSLVFCRLSKQDRPKKH